MPAVIVRSVRASSAACERLDRLYATLRSFLDDWTEASRAGGKDSTFGCRRSRLRWGERYVALWIERRLPVGSWRFDGGFWVVERVCEGLESEVAEVVVLDRMLA